MKKILISLLTVLLFSVSVSAADFSKTDSIKNNISIKIINESNFSDPFFMLSKLPVNSFTHKLNYTYEEISETETTSINTLRTFVEASAFVILIFANEETRSTYESITNAKFMDIGKND